MFVQYVQRRRHVFLARGVLASCAALIAVTLGACYPVTGTFYRPSAPEGIIRGAYCAGSAGPKNSIDIRRGPATVEVSAFRGLRNQRPYVAVTITVPASYVLTAELADFVIVVPRKGASSKLHVLSIMGTDGTAEYIEPTNTFYGSRFATDNHRDSMYTLYFGLGNPEPKEFDVMIPEMSIDGNSYSGITVNYQTAMGMWINPINC